MIDINAHEIVPVGELSLDKVITNTIQGVFKFFSKPADKYSISVRLTDNIEIQSLNKIYRGFDKPTDILSFTSEEIDPETGLLHLGDLIISHEKIIIQAQDAGHSQQTEYALLVVHGMLHLFGYDHSDKEEKEEMWKLQKDILTSLDIFPNKLPE